LVLVLDEKDGVELFVCPEEILVQLQQSHGVEALQELVDLVIRSGLLQDVLHFTFGRRSHAKVGNEIQLTKSVSVQTRQYEVQLIKLISWVRKLSFQLLFVQLFLYKLRDDGQNCRQLFFTPFDAS
jgi:hypothetical protein